MAAILLQPAPPPLICLEEPELGMHPDLIRMVAGMIIEASAKTQLIGTTHSEHLLTALQDDLMRYLHLMQDCQAQPSGASANRNIKLGSRNIR